MDVKVSVFGVEPLRKKLGLIVSAQMKREITSHVGIYVTERVKDFLDKMAVTRHKTADRLGAEHTRYFEFASGRVGGVRNDGSHPSVESSNATPSSVDIDIKNTPGLRRAFGPMVITPKKAKALTIPINRISYGKSVRDLKHEGRILFRFKSKKGNSILAESDGNNGIRPLYVLVKKSVVPQDAGLLPSKSDFQKWALEAAGGKMREMMM